jgi:hypothetical protein
MPTLTPQLISKDEQAVIDWMKNHKFPDINGIEASDVSEIALLWQKATDNDPVFSVRLYWLCEFAK